MEWKKPAVKGEDCHSDEIIKEKNRSDDQADRGIYTGKLEKKGTQINTDKNANKRKLNRNHCCLRFVFIEFIGAHLCSFST